MRRRGVDAGGRAAGDLEGATLSGGCSPCNAEEAGTTLEAAKCKRELPRKTDVGADSKTCKVRSPNMSGQTPRRRNLRRDLPTPCPTLTLCRCVERKWAHWPGGPTFDQPWQHGSKLVRDRPTLATFGLGSTTLGRIQQTRAIASVLLALPDETLRFAHEGHNLWNGLSTFRVWAVEGWAWAHVGGVG